MHEFLMEIICMHVHVLQLKNMVPALFSSGGGVGNIKFFCSKGDTFEWDTIARLWKREGAERGLMSEAPKLIYQNGLMVPS